jgi:hypothetical protein
MSKPTFRYILHSLKYKWLLVLQCISLFLSDFASPFITLGDRDRYLSGLGDSLDLLNRTSFVTAVFSALGRPFEILLAVVSLVVSYALIASWVADYRLGKVNSTVLYVWISLPIHFILRSVAGKDLIAAFSLVALLLLLYPLLVSANRGHDTPIYMLRLKLGIHAQPLSALLLFAFFFLLLLLVRPFYLVPFSLLLLPWLSARSRLPKAPRHFSVFAASVLILVFFLVVVIDMYPLISQMIVNYFILDGRFSVNANLDSLPPDQFWLFAKQFILHILSPVIGPTLSTGFSSPSQFLALLEGLSVAIPLAFASGRCFLLFCFRQTMPLALASSVALSLSSLLFIYHVFGYVNYAGGWRYQSGSWPLLCFLYVLLVSLSDWRTRSVGEVSHC